MNRLSFGLIIMIAQTLMYFNAPAIFGEQFFEDYGSRMVGYLIFYEIFFASLVVHPAMKIPIQKGIILFVPFFFAGIIGASLIGSFAIFQVNLEPTTDVYYTRGVALYQILFVANVEEAIFRSLLPTILPSFLILGFPVSSRILSSILFGLFHLGAYFYLASTTGQSLSVLIITATLAGVMFQFVNDRFGLTAAMGLHAGVNIANLGVL
ncbi:MAG: CPBP family intramembrane metalloprotease [Theionarchaea archaeon]|nr:CPBP family intramembrane metalloprotease [Theionarchaea archaeon]